CLTFYDIFCFTVLLCVLFMYIVIYITLLLDFDILVNALCVVTPFLIIVILIIAGYFFVNGHVSISDINSTVKQPSLLWGILQGFIYGGLAFLVGFSNLVVIGGDADKRYISC